MSHETMTGFRISPQQKDLWSAQPEGRPQRAGCAVLLEGRLDPAALRAALEQAAGRHEILRTSFHRRPGMKLPLQVVADEAAPEWQAAGADADVPDEQLRQLWAQARRPLDVERGPVLRALLLPLAPDRHALLLSLPSLCADLPTLHTLVAELAHLYGGAAESLPEQPLQYADYAEWRNQLAEADDDEARAGKQFWRQCDLASLPALRLPYQGAADAGAFEPEEFSLTLSADTMSRVDALAASQGSSPAVILLASWQALLARLGGQADLAVRYVADGRTQDELKGAMGPIAQPLPVRAHVEDVPFGDLLRQVQGAVTAACRWQDYCEPAGELAFDFEYDGVPGPRTGGGVSFALAHAFCHFNPFALKLSCARRAGGCRATFAYDPRQLRRDEVRRIAGYFERLLAGVVADPRASALAVEVLDPHEREQLLVGFNRTAADYPRDRCLHHLFEEQAARTPDRPALVCGDIRMTYAELNARANQIAHFLRGCGVGRNAPVGLAVERSADMIVALLGVLKAGGAYVPLHHEHPKARLAHQLRETGARVLLTHENLLSHLPEFSERILCLDRDRAQLESQPGTNPAAVGGPDDLVYVIYTSGSTGVPKGVAVRHRNLVNYAHFIRSKLGADAGHGMHFATVSTITADLGNTCVFPALISGGCLHVIGYDTAMDGAAFGRYVAANPIDVLKITPSHLQAVLGAADEKSLLPRRYLILGGEATSCTFARRLLQAGKCAVVNHYGPTETTVGSLTYDVPAEGPPACASGTLPVGRPIANTEVYILDAHRRPVPQGVVGELYIGGAGLAVGYLNQPEQTAERFVPHPFSTDPQARLYRTGDLARHLADGAVEFLGRADHQVKIRGFRVELAEIEAVLGRHAAVRQAVVVAREEPSGDKKLVAYVVPAVGAKATAEVLRGHLLEQLPEYMVPGTFVVRDSLPLTANGKIDRRALPDPEQEAAGRQRAYVAPGNPVEEQLAKIWGDVLGVERVGIEDNFFDLGGHSLLATQVISRIRTTLDVQVPLRTIFETPTVAGLARAVAELRGDGAPAEDVDRVLAELEGLSDEEIQRLLAADA
jgi:amino acid adenylation domain-containing protein